MARYVNIKFEVADGGTFSVSVPYAKSVVTEQMVRDAATAMIANSPWVTAPSGLRSASLRETTTTDLVEG